MWDTLYSLTARNQTADIPKRKIHPLVHEAVEWIERHLVEHSQVCEIARRFEISHNHLNTLFKKNLGCTVAQHMKKRKLQQAKLMMQQTDLTIKNIAAELGYYDLHRFNKFVRKNSGVSPRKLRETLNA